MENSGVVRDFIAGLVERGLKVDDGILFVVDGSKGLINGIKEALTLHRLGMFGKLGRSFKTTNCLESVNRQLGMYTGRVCRWRNSNMRQR